MVCYSRINNPGIICKSFCTIHAIMNIFTSKRSVIESRAATIAMIRTVVATVGLFSFISLCTSCCSVSSKVLIPVILPLLSADFSSNGVSAK